MYKRHNLLYFCIEGREEALLTLEDVNEEIINLISNESVPAIVSRQDSRKDGYIQCGFTSPKTYDGSRLRIGVEVLSSRVEKYYTPFDLVENANKIPKEELVNELIELGENTGFKVGFFGSFAMEIITGIKYTNEKSDIDIYIKRKRENFDFDKFYNSILELEEKHNIKIDGEVEIKEVFGVKIKEIYNTQKTVLAKGINSVEIFTKEEIWRD